MNKLLKKNINIIMAFDFGMKRIGVAIGQTIIQTARPLETLPAKGGIPDWNLLNKLIRKWEPDAFVVGIPLNMDGTSQPITHDARIFASYLKKHYQLPVYEIDERLTTKDARQRIFTRGGFKALKKANIDSIAAQLILQDWFAQNIS